MVDVVPAIAACQCDSMLTLEKLWGCEGYIHIPNYRQASQEWDSIEVNKYTADLVKMVAC